MSTKRLANATLVAELKQQRKRPRPCTRKSSDPLSVRISEDHNDALISFHEAIRIGQLPFQKITLVHIDAHPDMMIPKQFVADVVFDKHELYFQLDNSESGIAEYILPCVYAGHIDKIAWIRPSWAGQIRDGLQSFFVGKTRKSGHLAVTSASPYFVDENISVSAEEMETKFPLDMLVTQLGDTIQVETLRKMLPSGKAWILDICLDYFVTSNPFLNELEIALGKSGVNLVQKVFYEATQIKCIEDERIRHEDDDAEWYEKASKKQTVLSKLHQEGMERLTSSSIYSMPLQSWFKPGKCFDDPIEEPVFVEQMAVKLFRTPQEGRRLLCDFVQLMAQLSESQRTIVKECGPMCDLPKQLTTPEVVNEMMGNLHFQLEVIKSTWGTRPSLVTIARSSKEAFDYTPVDQVDAIESQVLRVLEQVYGKLDVERVFPTTTSGEPDSTET